ncbi:ECF RNA polymerase sigma factor SigK [Glycomyces mayteni]|uniref:RNA polymerase sigma factor n=1 Tax=Glycomyces mayteni TaxID=543887 RepID=A0ABW2D5I1_9ACTN|nr:sigma-70 family RNA polymerase sigma factor [Glycomyces mayteni]
MFEQGAHTHRREDRAHLSAVSGIDPDTSESLLHRTALGDEDAFAMLYDRTAPRVYGLCLRIVRDPAQAEEVAQEAMVEVWRTATRFDERRGSANAWITTIAHRKAVDRVRSAQASVDRERRVASTSAEIEYDQVAEAAEGRLEHRQVRRCLKTLTELQRQAVTLAYFGGHTYGQVATLLDSPVPTVKSRIRDGLIKLRDCLEAAR